jgi:hypothetical protein
MNTLRRTICCLAFALCAGPLAAQEPPPPAPPVAVAVPAEIAPPPETRDTPSPVADGPFGAFANPMLGHLVPRVTYQSRWFPEADVRGQPSSLGFWTQDLSAMSPIWQDDRHELSLTAGVRNQILSGGAVLPTTNMPLPDTLWNIKFGFAYRQQLDNDWTIGASVHFGSASDKPFHSIDEMQVGMQASLRIPVRERDAWLFSLSYSPLSEISFPIPGVAYQWVPCDQFQMLIGLPFALVYRPTEDWMLTMSYMPISNVRGRVSYRLLPHLRLYAGYEWANDNYYLADRADTRDRLFEYDMRVVSGIQYSMSPHFSFDVFGGYSFNRSIAEGHSFSDRNTNRIDLADTPFLGAQLIYRW